MRKLKSIVAFLMALTIVISATACSAQTTSSTKTTSSAQTVTVKVAKWGDTSKQQSDPDYLLAQEWNKSHPNIQIKLDIIPGDGYSTKLTTSFASGDGYDIFESGEGDFYKWTSLGVNQPLDKFISADKTFDSSSFSKTVYQMGNLGGKQYYLIKDYNPLVLYYNKKMFDDAKLSYPDDNTTWDQIFSDAAQLTKKNSSGKYTAYGFNASTWTYGLYAYLQSNGTDVADSTGLKVDGYLNSAATVAALDKWFNLAKNGAGKASPTSSNLDSFGGVEKMLVNNMLGMFISGYWSAPTLQENKANYGTAIIPKGSSEGRTSILCAAGYCISNKTSDPDAAWQVLKMLTDTDAQKIRVKSGTGILPTTQSLLDSQKSTISKQDMSVINVLPYCKQPIGDRSELGVTIDTEFNNALQLIMLGKSSTQDILNNCVKTIESKAK